MRSFLGRILAWLALLGGFLVLFWSGHRAAYSVWLNAHPLYDDAYWAAQFNKYFTIFAAALVVELGAVWWLIRLRRARASRERLLTRLRRRERPEGHVPRDT